MNDSPDDKAMTVPSRRGGHDGKPLCGAKTRGDGTCTQVAGWGTDHLHFGPCKLHGGRTPTVSRGAERQRVEAEARILFDKIAPDVIPVDNPLEAYAQFAGRVMAWLALMDSLLDDLDAPRYRGATAEQVRGEVQLFERAMGLANTVLGTYAKLNIDERLARVTEKQADVVLSAIDAMLSHLGIFGPAAADAKRVAARHLRALPASPEAGA